MRRTLTLLIIAVVSAEMVIDDHPYCAVRYRRLCQGKGRHVACQFPAPGPGEYCQNYTRIKFKRDMKRFITTYINRRRQRLAAGSERVRGGALVPRPQLMMQVEWDRELAMLAQRLADQCTFAHDDCRATVRYPYAGQTVGEVRWRRSSDSDELSAQRAIRRVLDAWWGERRRVYPKQIVAPFSLTPKGTSWGHFSQLAVWTLRAVGCAAVRHHHPPRLLLVCDFSHTNMLGQRTIAPGPLAPCPVHSIRKPRSAYPLLCASIRFRKNIRADYPFDTYDQEYDDDDERNADDIQEILEEEEVITAHEQTMKPRAKTIQVKPKKTFFEAKKQVTAGTILLAVKPSEKQSKVVRPSEEHIKVVRPNDKQRQSGEERQSIRTNRVPFQYRTTAMFHRNTIISTKSRWRLPALNHRPVNKLGIVDPHMPLQGSRPGPDNQRVKALKFWSDIPHKYTLREETESSQNEEQRSMGNDEDRNVNSINKNIGFQQNMPPLRARWQQTRDRPLRPGANALLTSQRPMAKYQRPPEKVSAKISIKMDKDDEDQLFRDTGFKLKQHNADYPNKKYK